MVGNIRQFRILSLPSRTWQVRWHLRTVPLPEPGKHVKSGAPTTCERCFPHVLQSKVLEGGSVGRLQSAQTARAHSRGKKGTSRAWEHVLGMGNSQIWMWCRGGGQKLPFKARSFRTLDPILLGEWALFSRSWQALEKLSGDDSAHMRWCRKIDAQAESEKRSTEAGRHRELLMWQLWAGKDKKDAEYTCSFPNIQGMLLSPSTESQRIKIIIPPNVSYSENLYKIFWGNIPCS